MMARGNCGRNNQGLGKGESKGEGEAKGKGKGKGETQGEGKGDGKGLGKDSGTGWRFSSYVDPSYWDDYNAGPARA